MKSQFQTKYSYFGIILPPDFFKILDTLSMNILIKIFINLSILFNINKKQKNLFFAKNRNIFQLK